MCGKSFGLDIQVRYNWRGYYGRGCPHPYTPHPSPAYTFALFAGGSAFAHICMGDDADGATTTRQRLPHFYKDTHMWCLGPRIVHTLAHTTAVATVYPI